MSLFLPLGDGGVGVGGEDGGGGFAEEAVFDDTDDLVDQGLHFGGVGCFFPGGIEDEVAVIGDDGACFSDALT